MPSLEMPQIPRIRSKVNRVQILVFLYIRQILAFLSISYPKLWFKVMQNLFNTAMLYKQTSSSRHDVCLDQRSFKCKIGENCSHTLFI